MLVISRWSMLAAALMAVCSSVAAAAPASLVPMIGTWSGNGSVRLDNAQSEAVKCKVHYTDRGSAVGVALRCASAASKVDLRAILEVTGSKVAGTWEERQFNAAGTLTGSFAGHTMTLALEGGGVKADVVVATTGTNQTLTITAVTGGFKSVSVALIRE